MKEVMGELEKLGAIDPTARDALLTDLKQSDRKSWPTLLKIYRGVAEYKRREKVRLAGQSSPEGDAADGSRKDKLPSATEPAVGNQVAGTAIAPKEQRRQPGDKPSDDAAARSRRPDSPTAQDEPATPAPQPRTTSESDLDRRPALAPEPPTAALGNADAAAVSAAPEPPSPAVRLAALREATKPAAVAGGTAPLSESDWQAHLAAAIRTIEAESKTAAKSESDIALQARLRMLYLLAGRRNEAMRPLPSAPRATQEYWTSQIYGLSTWMDSERTPDLARRAAETKRILAGAVNQLGETAPLTVRNLTFCTDVRCFGSFDAVKSTEFKAGQKVLLYAEVENFRTESTPKGYRTAVKFSWQIFDSRGVRVGDFVSPASEETSLTPKHEFFLSKWFYLPAPLAPGRYTLQFTVEDTLGQKVGQSSIDLAIRP